MTAGTAQPLEEIPGVGPTLAARIRRHFGADERFFAAARGMDVQAIASVPGISRRRAMDLIHHVGGQSQDAVAATPAAQRLLDAILERAAACAATPHGRDRIRLLRPLATPGASEAAARRVMGLRRQAEALDRDEVRRALRRLHPPREAPRRRVDGRVVVALDDDALRHLEELGVPDLLDVLPATGLQRIDPDVLVVACGEGPHVPDEVVQASADAPLEDLVPEAVLGWFEANRGALEACARLAALLGRPDPCRDAVAALDATASAAASPADVRRAAQETLREAEAALRSRMAGLDLTGDDLLSALGRRLPPRVQAALDATLRDGAAGMARRCGTPAQVLSPTLPLELDDEEVARLEQEAAAHGKSAAFAAQVKAARRVRPLQEPCRQAIAHWLAFDADFALGCFAAELDLHPAAIGPGFAFEASAHLDLAGRDGTQPIGYRLGGSERIALLTGANSGGKTTLLEHLAQLALMVRLGLPVPGSGVQVPWVQEVHFVAGRRSLDAGAFESFLRSFLPLADDPRPRLVLADELEAMTELDAAARILAFFVRRLAATPTLAVLVTHMAPSILAHLDGAPVRVDGIEASGLDGSLRLVADRTPRIGTLARSTPELIVQRLAATAPAAQRDLFTQLLAALRAPAPKAGPARRLHPRG